MSEVLTGAETKKALECCTFSRDCLKCPSYIGKGTQGCVDRVKKGALDLINRYEARIKELEGKVVIQQGLIYSQKEEIETLRNSRARWRRIAEEFDRSIREEERAGDDNG